MASEETKRRSLKEEAEIYRAASGAARKAGRGYLVSRAKSVTDNQWVHGFALPMRGGQLYIVRQGLDGIPVHEECHPESLQMRIDACGLECWEGDLLLADAGEGRETYCTIRMDKDSGIWKLYGLRPVFIEGMPKPYLALTQKAHRLGWLHRHHAVRIRNLDGVRVYREKDLLGRRRLDPAVQSKLCLGRCTDILDAAETQGTSFDGERHLYRVHYTSHSGIPASAIFIAGTPEALQEAWDTYRGDNLVPPASVGSIARADGHCRSFADAAAHSSFPPWPHWYSIRCMSLIHGGEITTEAQACSREELEDSWDNWRRSVGILPVSIVSITVVE